MPWLALPYGQRDVKEALSDKYSVQGIPTLVVLDTDGKLITRDGRKAVLQDLDSPIEETGFPWKPQPFGDIMATATFVTHNTEQVATFEQLQALDSFALYFSAHWCGPCRAFTPKLAAKYEAIKTAQAALGKPMEIIFCSSDREAAAYTEYHGSMPWPALPYGDKRIKALSSLFEVQGIPTLITLKADGTVLNAEAEQAFNQDAEYPFLKVPLPTIISIENQMVIEALQSDVFVVLDLSACSSDDPTIPAVQAAFSEAVTALYTQSVAQSAPQTIRGVTTPTKKEEKVLTDAEVSVCRAGHPLTEATAEQMQNHRCDVCRGGFSGVGGWQCKECDFDRCLACYAGKRAPVPTHLGLLNQIRAICEVDVPTTSEGPLVYVCFSEVSSSSLLSEPITVQSVTQLVNAFVADLSSAHAAHAGGCGDAHCSDAHCGDGGCDDDACGDGGCGDAACGDAACGDGGCGDAACGDKSCEGGQCGEQACADGAQAPTGVVCKDGVCTLPSAGAPGEADKL